MENVWKNYPELKDKIKTAESFDAHENIVALIDAIYTLDENDKITLTDIHSGISFVETLAAELPLSQNEKCKEKY
jgi:hypothetical protein